MLAELMFSAKTTDWLNTLVPIKLGAFGIGKKRKPEPAMIPKESTTVSCW